MSTVIETQQTCPNFGRLKSELLNHPNGAALYYDPVFQPRFSTLFNKHSKIDFSRQEINWNRPTQLSKQPCLVSSKGIDDIKVLGGRLSPDWFPVLFALLKEKELLELVIPDLYSQNNFNQNASIVTPNTMTYCGAFLFRFRRGGLVEDVVIDDLLPTTIHCHLLTAISSDMNEFLPALIEKAYAKFVGGYYNLAQQHYLTALMDFTGGLVETISMRGNELLTVTEIESFYGKLNSMLTNSFAFGETSRAQPKDDSSRPSIELYLITGVNEIPLEPPNDMINLIIDSFNDKNSELVPLVRMISVGLEDANESRINGGRIDQKWNECAPLIRSKYGLVYNDNRESWVPIEELPYICNQIVIVYFLIRNPIMALAKKQEYWNFFFFDNFWHRDGPRGDVDVCGDEFLRNPQYLCIVNKTEGCSVKIVLTNTQKYVDSGANAIQRGRDTKTGITILEVERNRQYTLHSISLSRVVQGHVDSRIDRSLIISAFLEIGRYVIIPWISAGCGTRFTIQMFSSVMDTEFSYLHIDAPSAKSCVSCQISKTMAQTKSKLSSIYRSQSTISSDISGQRKASSPDASLCKDCDSFYPKRATRISVLYIEMLGTVDHFKFPSLYFEIQCEREKYKSRTLPPTSNPQWNEHYIFYRFSVPNSKVTLKVCSDGTLGTKVTVTTHTFSEKELREDGNFFIYINFPSTKENELVKSRLVLDLKNYVPSAFSAA